MNNQPYDWGRRPPSRIDWAFLRFCLVFVTVLAVLVVVR